MSALSMTKAGRESFLSGLHVGIVVIANGDAGPLAAPVWYGYEPGGDAWFATGRNSQKARLLSPGKRATLIVQDEAPPYRYVSIEGPVALEDCDYERHIKAMAYRYLGPEQGERYLEMNGRDAQVAGSIVVRIRPEKWRTQDYGKPGRGG